MPAQNNQNEPSESGTAVGYTEETFLTELQEHKAPNWTTAPNTLVGEQAGKPILIYEVPKGKTPSDITCFDCGHRLIAYRKVSSPHFKHSPGSPDDCPGRGPEGALHSLVKQWLAKQLHAGGTSLQLWLGCGLHKKQIGPSFSHTICFNWSSTRMEKVTGTIRPDIVLLDNDTPICAIEVEVSNPVSAEKAEVFADMGMPWVEIRASSLLRALKIEEAHELWNLSLTECDLGIPTARYAHHNESWACPLCMAASAKQSSPTEGAKRATVLRRKQRKGEFVPLWVREHPMSFRSRESTFTLRIALVLSPDTPRNLDAPDDTWGIYMGDDLYPLFETPLPQTSLELSQAREKFKAVVVSFYGFLRTHGVDLETPYWSPRQLYRLPSSLRNMFKS